VEELTVDDIGWSGELVLSRLAQDERRAGKGEDEGGIRAEVGVGERRC
jgi:hypothetical protein